MAEGTTTKVVVGKVAKTGRKKTECPLTKEEFEKEAKPLKVMIDGKEVTATVKMFSSGSYGFTLNEKVTLEVGGKPVKFQCGMNLTAIGSKPEKE